MRKPLPSTAIIFTLLAAVTTAQRASAGTFGASVNTYVGTLTPCAESVVGSIPVKIDVPSHVFANAVTTYSGQNNPKATGGYYYVQLRPSGSSSPVGFINYSTVFDITSTASATLVSSGVLQNLSSGMPITVEAGDYILEFIVHGATQLCSVEAPLPSVYYGNLSYLILSSTSDQIFTSGFNAMLYGENRARNLA
jgi:hypothetical protein